VILVTGHSKPDDFPDKDGNVMFKSDLEMYDS